MHALTRAALAAILVFWALCSLFFVQPFTGSFALVALPAAAIAAIVFVVLRGRPGAPDPRAPSGPGPQGPAVAAIAIGALLVLLGLLFAVGRWPLLWDPCHTWDDHSTTKTTSPDDPCSSSSATAQTRAAFLLDSALGEGVLLVGGAFAVWAGLRRRPGVLAAVGVAMLSPTVILFRGMSLLFIVAFLLGVGLVLAALLMRPGRRLEAPAPSA
jgi:hypothetical protein